MILSGLNAVEWGKSMNGTNIENRAAALEARFRESGLFYAKIGVMTSDTGRITLNA